MSPSQETVVPSSPNTEPEEGDGLRPPSSGLGNTPRQHRGRVLVVDLDRDKADALGEEVERIGATARVCYDAPTAVDVAREFQPAVVLLAPAVLGGESREVGRRIRGAAGPNPMLLVVLGGTADVGEGCDVRLPDHRDTEALGLAIVASGG